MKIVGIIKSIEELIYDVIFLLFQTPKTFIKIIINPRWISNYVKDELKNDNDKFAEYLSPLMIWTISVVIPFYLGTKHFFTEVFGNNDFSNKFSNLGVEGMLLAIALFLISYPL